MRRVAETIPDATDQRIHTHSLLLHTTMTRTVVILVRHRRGYDLFPSRFLRGRLHLVADEFQNGSGHGGIVEFEKTTDGIEGGNVCSCLRCLFFLDLSRRGRYRSSGIQRCVVGRAWSVFTCIQKHCRQTKHLNFIKRQFNVDQIIHNLN